MNLILQERVIWKVSFDYIDWIKVGFGPLGKENYYMYKSLVFYQKRNMKLIKLKEIEQYVKEQEETNL